MRVPAWIKNKSEWSDDQEWDLWHCGPNHTKKSKNDRIPPLYHVAVWVFWDDCTVTPLGIATFHLGLAQKYQTQMPATIITLFTACRLIQANNQELEKQWKNSFCQKKLGHAWGPYSLCMSLWHALPAQLQYNISKLLVDIATLIGVDPIVFCLVSPSSGVHPQNGNNLPKPSTMFCWRSMLVFRAYHPTLPVRWWWSEVLRRTPTPWVPLAWQSLEDEMWCENVGDLFTWNVT